MRGNPFLKRYPFVRQMNLSKEELTWLQGQAEKLDEWRRHWLLLEVMFLLQDEQKAEVFAWVEAIVNEAAIANSVTVKDTQAAKS